MRIAKLSLTIILCALILAMSTAASSAIAPMDETLINGYCNIIQSIILQDRQGASLYAVDVADFKNLTYWERVELIKKVSFAKFCTYDELVKKGLIIDDRYGGYFPSGVFVSVHTISYSEQTKVIRFAYIVWKSPLGAYGSDNASAAFNGVKWSTYLGDRWIS